MYARFFRYLQGATFYRSTYRDAVQLLPPGDGRQQLDVGCGPGLIPRLTAQRGYLSRGIDRSAAMIAEARRGSCRSNGNPQFEVSDLENHVDTAGTTYDVVSAASFLAVVPDTTQTVQKLWNLVVPGGYLLVIEPTQSFTEDHARSIARRDGIGRRGFLLTRWARAREGRAVDLNALRTLTEESPRIFSHLDGMVESWVVRKPMNGAGDRHEPVL